MQFYVCYMHFYYEVCNLINSIKTISAYLTNMSVFIGTTIPKQFNVIVNS